MRSFTHHYWGRCIRLLMVMLLVFAQPLAFASHVPPVFVAGNPTCSALGFGDFEIKFEPVADGSLTQNGVTVTVDVRNTGAGQVFDWTSSGGVVNAVVAKGGPDANLYKYDPAATSDTGLHAPVNPSNGKYYGLSHISFCVTPGEASIDVSKVCDDLGQTVQGDVVTTKNSVTLTNDGDFVLSDIQVREEASGPSCSITKVDGVAVDVALPLNTYVAVPSAGTFAGSLAVGASVVLEVTCTDDELNVANTISGKGTASNGDVVDDTSTNNPLTECPFTATPEVSIDKNCVDETDVRLMATPDGAGGTLLAVQVCPTIIVTNESPTEPLSEVSVTDSKIPGLKGPAGLDVLALAGVSQLNPGESISLGDFMDLCYMPSAPEVAAFEGGKYLPSHAGFLNVASVLAEPKFGEGFATDSDDTALRDGDDNILYLLDENGEQVLDTAGNPIPLSECPLCAPCPDCPTIAY